MKQFRKVFILFLSTLIVTISYSQNSKTLNLYIENNEGESVINAYISINDKITLSTNQFGFCTANIVPGNKLILISHVSYKNKYLDINFINDTTLFISLESNSLASIDIYANTKRDLSQLEEITLENFKKIPSVLGEPDIIANLTLLPGVSNAKEGSTGFSVRGGETYQNSILVDRSLLLNTSHLFGLLSTVNSKVINDVKLYKNHIPARFGNSSASIVDISIKDGNKDSISYDFNIGLTNSGLVINGPITSKLKFLFGIRSAYLGLLTLPAYVQYQRDKIENYGNYNFYDYNAKLRYDFSPSDRITLHFYSSKDNVFAQNKFAQENENTFKYNWQNLAINLSQYKQFKNGAFWNNYLSYSSYNTNLSNLIEGLNDNSNSLNSSARKSDFKNFSYQSQISKNYGTSHLVRFGFEAEQMVFTPLQLTFINNNEESVFNPLTFNLKTLSLYLDNDLQLLPKLIVNYGLRFTNYLTQKTNFSYLEPRISLKYQFKKDQYIETSFNKYTQNRIQFPLLNFGFPLDIIIPVYDKIKPPITTQYNLSYVNNSLINDKFSIVSSVYFKQLNQITTIDKVVPFINNFDGDFQDYLAFDGIGIAAGIELSIRYSNLKNDLTLNYHLSRSFRKYPNLNNANWFPHEFDRLHELNIIYSFSPNSKWSYYLNFALFSGSPTTLPTGIIEVDEDFYFYVFNERNNYRLPPFHRANISIERRFRSKRNRPYQISFSLYNAYNSNNPYDANLIKIEDKFIVQNLSVFPIIPSINYNTSF